MKPNVNSHRLVAEMIYKDLGRGTINIILADGPEAVKALNLLTEGFAASVRDELIKLVWELDKPEVTVNQTTCGRCGIVPVRCFSSWVCGCE